MSTDAIFRVGFIALMLLVMFGVSACATQGMHTEEYVPTVDVSGLERDDSESPNVIYRRPGGRELGEINRFIIDPVQVFYEDPKMQELSPEQVSSMQEYLLYAVGRELRDAGYEVGTRSEPDTLRISFTLSGLKAPSAGSKVVAALVPYPASIGEATVEAIFRDGLTNRLEGVAVAHARGFRWLNSYYTWSTWGDVEKFLDDWAKAFRESVDEAHAH